MDYGRGICEAGALEFLFRYLAPLAARALTGLPTTTKQCPRPREAQRVHRPSQIPGRHFHFS